MPVTSRLPPCAGPGVDGGVARGARLALAPRRRPLSEGGVTMSSRSSISSMRITACTQWKGDGEPGRSRHRAPCLPMESRPVFADLSGRRRRIMQRVGLGLAAVLVVCLGVVVVAVAGGPQAPFTGWAAPQARVAAVPSHGRSRTPDRGGGNAGPSQPGAQPGPVLSPLPSTGASARPSDSPMPSSSAPSSSSSPVAARSSPVPTNPAGHTPPGSTRSPSPRKSSHGA
jgi:hypothetical protein